MSSNNVIPLKTKLFKCAAALIMCGCLVLLTGINFIVYGNQDKSISIALKAAEDIPDETSPGGPVEENSSTVNVSIQEEYVHEPHSLFNLAVIDNALKYSLLDEAKLAIVHFELISPPPDL